MQLLIARKGNPEIIEAPDPHPAENEVLIQTAFSAVSAGTELSALSEQPASLAKIIRKGLGSAQKIKQSILSRGLKQTLHKANAAIEKPLALGYSLTGKVLEVGEKVHDIKAGDFVTAVGPKANHSTLASVPRLFCAKLSYPHLSQDSAISALACIGIHAMNRADLHPDSHVAVFGLGIIGQMTTQALLAAGHRVIGFDPQAERREAATRAGAQTFNPHAFEFEYARTLSQHEEGLDAVFLCAKTTSSSIIHHALACCKRRGKIIIVGEFPIQVPREEAYEKEIEFRISAGYGEGRYDPSYAHQVKDPVIKGTVQKNLLQFLQWLEEGEINLDILKPEVRSFQTAAALYRTPANIKSTLLIFSYPGKIALTPKIKINPKIKADPNSLPLAIIGGGRFVKENHLPYLVKSNLFHVTTIVGKTPLNVFHTASKFGVPEATCHLTQALQDEHTQAVLIATPPPQHAHGIIESLKAGKHIFVEKPMCILKKDHEEIEKLYRAKSHEKNSPVFFVGFNRRFSPISQQLKAELKQRTRPIEIHYIFHRLPLTATEWHGTSLRGHFQSEVCHAVDWILWMAESPIYARSTTKADSGDFIFSFQFENKSKAVLHYKPVLNQKLPKEKIIVGCGEQKWEIINFLQANIFRQNSLTKRISYETKGHQECWRAFASAIKEKPKGTDPFGFFASSELILTLSQELPHSG